MRRAGRLPWRSTRCGGLLLAFLLWLSVVAPLHAQVLDDTTKVLYGPLTTKVIRERNVLRDITTGQTLDTTLLTFHNIRRYWLNDTTYQQDLGNLGTASRKLLWEQPTKLGARLGRTVFDKYARTASDVVYYDTRSPYTFFRYLQGGLGEQIFQLSYARSLKKNANLGVSYERLASNKVLAASPREGLIRHSGITIFGRYQTEDERYHLLANYIITRHEAVEQGGIRPLNDALIPLAQRDTSLNQLFDYQRERVWLSQALNRDNRDDAHLAHTYRLLGKGLTAFHVFDFNRQQNRYNDEAIPYDASGNILYYPRFSTKRQTQFDSTKTEDRALFRQIENTVGVLGHTDAVDYRVYGRHRNARLETRSLIGGESNDTLPIRTFNNFFVGGNAAFRYQQFAIQTAGEYKIGDEYWVRASARLGFLTAELFSSSYSPTLTEQQFSGNHFAWSHIDTAKFKNTQTNQLLVRLEKQLGAQRFLAEGSVVNISNLIFYNQDGKPEQLNKQRQLYIGRLRHRLVLGGFYTDHDLTLTGNGDGEGLRIPTTVLTSRIAYRGFLFKKALFGQVGVETYFQSRWRAYDYSPSTQQFFVQDHFTVRSYPLVDVFLTGDIKTVTVFLKMAYLNQGLLHNGYFATPYYTGNPRSFQFGIKWNFFD
ncbi:putative porin [Hymenobacter sp. DG25B]|uniref:putative porin n=1 Tax=Hymenobacter sp. DG25B TaxID=1385664 RepID=UPI0018CF6ACE|nr:putative porin [Hymenobacter sp. DG25B]